MQRFKMSIEKWYFNRYYIPWYSIQRWLLLHCVFFAPFFKTEQNCRTIFCKINLVLHSQCCSILRNIFWNMGAATCLLLISIKYSLARACLKCYNKDVSSGNIFHMKFIKHESKESLWIQRFNFYGIRHCCVRSIEILDMYQCWCQG